jgi:hypothetical protein
MKDAAVLAPFHYTLDGEIYKSLLMSCDNTCRHDQKGTSSWSATCIQLQASNELLLNSRHARLDQTLPHYRRSEWTWTRVDSAMNFQKPMSVLPTCFHRWMHLMGLNITNAKFMKAEENPCQRCKIIHSINVKKRTSWRVSVFVPWYCLKLCVMLHEKLFQRFICTAEAAWRKCHRTVR